MRDSTREKEMNKGDLQIQGERSSQDESFPLDIEINKSRLEQVRELIDSCKKMKLIE